MTLQEFHAAYHRATAHGWLSLEEALLLVLTAERTAGPMVEVGTYHGRSAMVLASVEVGTRWTGRRDGDRSWERVYGRRTLHCVDPWDDAFTVDQTGEEILAQFRANLQRLPSKGANVVIHRCRVENWEPVPAEFVYLDGDHTCQGTRNQIGKALVCKPLWVAVHDIADRGGGAEVARAAVEMLGPWAEKAGKLAVWGPLR